MTFQIQVTLTWQDLLTAFPIGGLLTFLLLALGHWIPVGGGRGQLPTTVYGLVSRYTYGSFMALVGYAVALALLGLPWWLVVGLLAVYTIGGSAVVIAYGWDRIHDAIMQSRMAKRADDELRPQG